MYSPLPRKILLAVLSLALIGLGWRFAHELSFRDSSIVFEKGDFIEITPGQSITQTFTPKSGRLTRLEFLMRNPEPKKDDRVTVTLATADCVAPLRESQLRPGFLRTDNLFRATFEPILVSGTDPYCVRITFDPNQAVSKGVRFFVRSSDPLHTFTLADVPQASTELTLRPVYIAPGWITNWSQLNERLAQYKPWFLKDGWLVLIEIIFTVSAVGVLTLLILRSDDES